MSTDIFGDPVASAPTGTSAPRPAVPTRSKLVFGQAPASPSTPVRPAPPPARPGPTPLPVGAYARPEPERRLDAAQAAVLLFAALQRLAERQLFELRQAHPEREPRLPSADDVRLAAGQLIADPALQLRLALLTGAFRIPTAPPAPAPAPADESDDPGDADEPDEADTACDEACAVPEAPPLPGRPTRRAVAPPPTSGRVPERVARLIAAISAQAWPAADALVQHLPADIQAHWQATNAAAQQAWAQIAAADPAGATVIAATIDSDPIRAALEAAIAAIPAPASAPSKPQRRSAGRAPEA